MSSIPPSYGRRVSLFHVEAGLLATGSPDKTVEVITMIVIEGMVMMMVLVTVMVMIMMMIMIALMMMVIKNVEEKDNVWCGV